MATEQEVFELVYKYIGEDEAKRLQDHLEQQRQKSATLQAQLDAMNAASQTTVTKIETEAQARARMTAAIADEERATAKYIQTVQMEAEAVEKATQKQEAALAKASKKIGDGTNVARQGFVDISRATQDFAQGGFSAIVNNLEGIGRGLPAILKNPMALLSSLPSMLTLVGVALLALGPKIGEFMKWLSAGQVKEFGTEIENLTKKIEAIKDRMKDGVKLHIDTIELDIAEKKLQHLKEAQAAYDADQKKQTVAQSESGKAIEEAVTESKTGAPGATAKIAEQFRGEKERVSPELQLALADKARTEQLIKDAVGEPEKVEILKVELAKEQQRILTAYGNVRKEAEQAAGDLFRNAKEGNQRAESVKAGTDQASQQKELARRLALAGEGDLAQGVGALSPAAMAQAKAAHEKQKKELDAIARSKVGDTAATALGGQAAAQGLGPEAAFKFISDELKKVFAAELAKRGATAPAGLEKTKEGKQAAEELASAIAQLAGRGLDKANQERDKADAADRKQKLTAITKGDALDKTADELVKAAAGGGLAPEEEFAKVRDQLAAEILARLKAQGVDTEAAETTVAADTAAGGIAEKAMTRGGRKVAKDEHEADRLAAEVATDFGRALKDGLLQEARKALAAGQAWDQVQQLFATKGAAAMAAGGIHRDVVPAATTKLVTNLMGDLRAEIGAGAAGKAALAAPKPQVKLSPIAARKAAAKAQEDARKGRLAAEKKAKTDKLARAKAATQAKLHPKAKPVPKAALTPQQQAAAAAAKAEDQKDKQKTEAARNARVKQQRDAQVNQLAGQFQRHSRADIGIQFTPEQAKKAAEETVKALGEGANADQAILQAMDAVLANMAKLGNRFAAIQLMAVRQQRAQANFAAQMDQMQPAAANIGGGAG